MAKTLLVIDDSSTIHEAVRLALTGAEWEAITATNGEEAAAALQQHRVDAILCDVTPGEEDGYELCRGLGASAAGTGIPILLMGGSVNATAALAVGASSTLPKPFAASQLVQTLSETLEQGDFSFDFDDVPVALAQESVGEPEAVVEEFELESTAYAYADDELDAEEIEVIDLSDEGEFDDLELLDDLPPVELAPVREEPASPTFATGPEFAAPPAQETPAMDAEGPGFGELLEPTVGDFAEEPEPAEAEVPRPDDGLDWGLEQSEKPAFALEPEVAAAPAEEETVADAEGPGFGELLEPTVGDFAEKTELSRVEPPRPDDGLDWGLEEMDGLPATPAVPVEPVDLSDILGGTEEAPSSQDQASDGGEYDVVSAPAAAGAGEGDVEFELPEATGDQMAEVPGTPEFAEQEPAGFEFEDREIPEDAFDGDLLPDAGETAEPPAGPALELEEAAEQEAALDMASLREVDSVDIGLDDLGGGPEQEPSAPIHEPAFPAPEGQAPPITPEPQEDLAVAESADEEWQVSIDDAPPAPAWDEVTMEAVTDLPEQPGAVEEMRTETESETSEAVAPGWSDLDSAFSPGEEPAKPASDESITEPRDDLTAGLAATAGRAVREALERSLSAEQLAPVIAAAVERVAWEVVPQLAERLIRETIEKLQQDPPAA